MSAHDAADDDGLRGEIASAAARLLALGLTQGTSGNLSARVEGGMLITASAVPYDAFGPSDVVRLDLAGDPVAPPPGRRPSTEWRMHAAILAARGDVNAIVHTHSPWATALSCLRRDIPAFHYMVAIAGGSTIRCAEYATFGTAALADAVVEALGDRRACLLANHGLVACGETVTDAMELAGEVEALAAQFARALSVGEPVLLDELEMARVLERFADYRP